MEKDQQDLQWLLESRERLLVIQGEVEQLRHRRLGLSARRDQLEARVNELSNDTTYSLDELEGIVRQLRGIVSEIAHIDQREDEIHAELMAFITESNVRGFDFADDLEPEVDDHDRRFSDLYDTQNGDIGDYGLDFNRYEVEE